MRKTLRLLLASPLLAALACLLCFITSEREPVYDSRTLSQWLTIYRSAEAPQVLREEATVAIRTAAPKALSLLIRRASKNRSPPREWAAGFLVKHPGVQKLIPRSFTAWVTKPTDETRANEARLGLMLLGRDAAPAIPQLMRLSLGSSSRPSTWWALEALGDIGPVTLPTLLTILTNSSAPCRAATTRQIARFGTNASAALPTIIGLLQDTNDLQLAYSSADAIGTMASNPDLSVPALAHCLESPDRTLRIVAVNNLFQFGPQADQAIPALLKALARETDDATRNTYLLMLRKLDKDAGHPRALIYFRF